MQRSSPQDRCLLVDIGNSRIKWNTVAAGTQQFELTTQAVDWSQATLSSVLDTAWQSLTNVSRVCIANVAGPEVHSMVDQWWQQHHTLTPEFFTTTSQFHDLINGYQNTAELGIDRWLGLIAARHAYPAQPLIVIGCGSATTIDSVAADGRHQAGPIMPGRRILLQALAEHTALDVPPLANFPAEMPPFADGTRQAIVSGVNFAAVSAINSAIDVIIRQQSDISSKAAAADGVKIIVTGGAAQALLPLTHLKNALLEPDLVLNGLLLLSMDVS